jgi:hypothetical protein
MRPGDAIRDSANAFAPGESGRRRRDLTKSLERSEEAFAKPRRPYFAPRSAREQNRDGGI